MSTLPRTLLVSTEPRGPTVGVDMTITGGSSYVDYCPTADLNRIILDGDFNVEELEAMAAHMRTCQKYAGRE